MTTKVPIQQKCTFELGRNNAKNIKTHNDKLHKEQDKAKAKKTIRAEQLKAINEKV